MYIEKDLDELIATKIMEWEKRTILGDMLIYMDSGGYRTASDWNPSTNIVHAWIIVEKMKKNDYDMNLYTQGKHTHVYFKNRFSEYYNSATSTPLAICRAALATTGRYMEEVE